MNKGKKKKKKRRTVSLRLNFLFFIVFLLFSGLIIKLGVVQIVYGDEYLREVERTENDTISTPVPRGKMYDRYFNPIVDNKPLKAITYTKYPNTKSNEMLETAEKLATLIEQDTEKITERDKKDFWLLTHQKEAEALITDKDLELVKNHKLEEKDLYKLQLERIKETELDKFTDDEMEVLAIFREFNSGYALTPSIVKNKDVTEQEFARVSERLDSLPGVGVTTDWERDYPYDETLRSVIGKVSSSDEGLPRDNIDYYLARGYSRNDRVGLSYLEKQYEDILHGKKAKMEAVLRQGEVVDTKPLSEGERGKDLVLTIDMELQLAVEEIIETELRRTKAKGNTYLLDRAFVVLMDPNTGEVLTMAGKQYVRNSETGAMEIKDFALGNITTSYTMGSSVKGATVYTGFQLGAISPGTTFYDTKMRIGRTLKGSYANLGPVSDVTALKKSSNVYMFQTAIKIGGGNYVPGQALRINPNAFSVMRNHYAQFGLGVRTGIDLPNETPGARGPDTLPGLLLDLSIGQYDTYTPMQLAQYVSTIANGGKRLQPQIVKEIHEPSNEETIGPVFQQIQPKVLNDLNGQEVWIDRVQEGFRQVAQEAGGTAAKYFMGKSYRPAAKTGTAEAFYDGPRKNEFSGLVPTTNLTLVGYAPYNNPEIAMSIVVPWAYQSGGSDDINKRIGQQALDTYFKLKEERASGKKSE
ncbi:penicillin-binding protein [Peribacillus asahii]|uniref:serine-type D-Ala-D-Ala carboxypeptidase n=1 Tax=Peribacillus asahii TaxID=228899 RepID=A0A3T0KMR9_9BACI|nr:penicillin-binding protein 2 [Peribacillus asahii]AZV41558.1 penicillin-binding protein [Peribacillus asahii]USK85918.1 penicillin-binding protein 2 [Peribacillus asahii]